MAFIPATNTIKAEMRFTYQLQACENVIHFKKGSPVEEADFDVIGNNIVTAWDANIKPAMGSDLSLDSIKFTDLTSETGPTKVYTSGLPSAGTMVSFHSLPSNVTVVASLKSIKRGRSYQGRFYHIGLDETHVDGNYVNLPMRATILLFLETVMGESAVEGYDLSIVSYYHNNAPRISAEVTPVATIFVGGTLDSQRRRLPGRGR